MCEGDYRHRRIECQTNQITSSVTDNLMVDGLLGVSGWSEAKKNVFMMALQMEVWR